MADDDKKAPAVSRVDAAAILLMSLGEADAAQILKHMGQHFVLL